MCKRGRLDGGSLHLAGVAGEMQGCSCRLSALLRCSASPSKQSDWATTPCTSASLIDKPCAWLAFFGALVGLTVPNLALLLQYMHMIILYFTSPN